MEVIQVFYFYPNDSHVMELPGSYIYHYDDCSNSFDLACCISLEPIKYQSQYVYDALQLELEPLVESGTLCSRAFIFDFRNTRTVRSSNLQTFYLLSRNKSIL